MKLLCFIQRRKSFTSWIIVVVVDVPAFEETGKVWRAQFLARAFVSLTLIHSNATIMISFATFYFSWLVHHLLASEVIICTLRLLPSPTTIISSFFRLNLQTKRLCKYLKHVLVAFVNESSARRRFSVGNYARMLNWGNEISWATFHSFSFWLRLLQVSSFKSSQ